MGFAVNQEEAERMVVRRSEATDAGQRFVKIGPRIAKAGVWKWQGGHAWPGASLSLIGGLADADQIVQNRVGQSMERVAQPSGTSIEGVRPPAVLAPDTSMLHTRTDAFEMHEGT